MLFTEKHVAGFTWNSSREPIQLVNVVQPSGLLDLVLGFRLAGIHWQMFGYKYDTRVHEVCIKITARRYSFAFFVVRLSTTTSSSLVNLFHRYLIVDH